MKPDTDDTAPDALDSGDPTTILDMIDDDTTLDDLAEASRAELDAAATKLGLDASSYKNKEQIAGAILNEMDEDDAPDPEEGGPDESMARDPALADVKRWTVKSPVQYMNNRGKKRRGEVGETLEDIPSSMAQDLHKRGCLDPVLR
jgi:hypothetical protein